MSNGERRSERVSNPAPMIAAVAGALVVVVVAVLVYFLVIRDDSDNKSGGSHNPGSSQTGPKSFSLPGVPFTFSYPANFAAVNPPAGFVWISGIGPFDIIDIKRLANQERSIGATRSSVKQSLNGRPGLTVLGERTETNGGVPMVRFQVDSNVSGQTLHSKLYYFSLGGASWQFECQSTDKNRTAMDAACAQALGSFSKS